MTPKAHIIPRLESVYEGHTVVLECLGSVHPVKATAQLAFGDHITVEWFGLDGHLIPGIKKNSNIGSTSSLTITQTSYKHTGLYSCQVTVDLPAPHIVITKYHLVLLSELFLHDSAVKISMCTHIISSENLTVSLPDSEVPPIIQDDDIRCTWSGGEIARMEWLFIDESTIVPMKYTNISWNNEEFVCMQIPMHASQPEQLNLTVKGKNTRCHCIFHMCVYIHYFLYKQLLLRIT